ncbi:MAG: glyoxylate/hydroxypyruvate reductase A [Alphaproteobacteria bacterium]|nr:glyoxylate/hydroxypyruvate reductase A [Alphaproteobacteria bacterium]
MSAFLFVTPSWDGHSWAKALRHVAPHMDVRVWPDCGREEDVHYVAAWLPPANALKRFPNLKAIFSLGAGVDAILSDPTLPSGIPIVRVNDADLTGRMSEYIVLHVLMHHRQMRRLADNQSKRVWENFDQRPASAMTVGIMGLGVLGTDAARKLLMMGFKVVGWSRSAKALHGVRCFDGASQLDAFLNETDILISLLPATPETDGIINRELISKLSCRGPLGAPVIINAGRGRQHVEADILHSLDTGRLHAASLDVFASEPLSTASPLWAHPKVVITPHNAADSDPAVICSYVAGQIARFERGEELVNLVDLKRGY